MAQALNDLAASQVSIWLDDLSRPRIQTGSLARMVKGGEIVGITTNPTIFAKAIGAGSGYEDQLRDLALRGTAIGETLRLLTAWDVRAACDILRPVYERTAARDGRVSIEVDPRISGDTDRTAAEARGLWWLVDRPNLFIKIPATLAGLPAITASLADGISVNVTLIFSLNRYRAVLDAFLTGMEQRKAAGGSVVGIESVASFFISRVDTEVDRRLGQMTAQASDKDLAAELDWLRGQAALANARLAYEIYEQMLLSDRWKALAAVGARPQRLLWASTGVKDKTFSDTRYVTDLVAPDTVNTMPEATLLAVADHGEILGDAVRGSYAAAHAIFETLSRAGLDIEEVANTLEEQGIASFAKSWDELIAKSADGPRMSSPTVLTVIEEFAIATCWRWYLPTRAPRGEGGKRTPGTGALAEEPWPVKTAFKMPVWVAPDSSRQCGTRKRSVKSSASSSAQSLKKNVRTRIDGYAALCASRSTSPR
jgi:transaldolase